MHYIGFDCHKKAHAWALLDEQGQLLDQASVANSPQQLRELRRALPNNLRVALEGSRDLRTALETAFTDCPRFEICAAWTHERRHKGRPRPKNDAHDARRVAQALYDEHEHLVPLPAPQEARQALQVALRLYRSTAREQKTAAQQLHAFLGRLWQGRYREIFRQPLCYTARCFFRAYPHPHKAARARSLDQRLRKWSRGRIGQVQARNIRDIAREFSAPTMAEELIMVEIKELLDKFDDLDAKTKRLRTLLESLVLQLGCTWLLDQPGLGPLRVATLIDAGFLESRHRNGFARLAGIAPQEDSSGERTRFVNASIRHKALFSTLMDWAHWSAMPRSNVPRARDYYLRKRSEGKTRCTALRCLARQLINRLFKLRSEHRFSSQTYSEERTPRAA